MMVPMIAPIWLLLMTVLLVVIIASVQNKRKQNWTQRQLGVKVCPHCGANQPPHANFCRRCGARLGEA